MGFECGKLTDLQAGAALLDRIAIRTLALAPNRISREERHARGLGYLLRPAEVRNLENAVSDLRLAAQATPSSDVLNDLGATYLLRAVARDDPRDLGQALVAAEEAIELDPRRPEPLFNRALALEMLHLRDQAVDAWSAYLARDSRSGWAEEAGEHLRGLVVPTRLDRWQAAVSRLEESTSIPDQVLEDLVRDFPQESREWTEGELLGRWAAAWLEGNHDRARMLLTWARSCALAKSRCTGDTLAFDAVVAVQTAVEQGNAAEIRRLAMAHQALQQSILLHRQSRPQEAQDLLAQAGRILRGAKSPLALWVDFYRASASYAQGQYVSSREELQSLLREIGDRRYLTISAAARRLLALTLYVGGDAEEGKQVLEEVVADFDLLGETANAAYARTLLAESCHLLGEHSLAWQYLHVAVGQAMEQGDPYRSTQILNAMADFTLRQGEVRLSALYQDASVTAARKLGNPSFLADVLHWRALLHQRLGRPQEADRDLEEAARQGRLITDADRFRQFQADHGLIVGAMRPAGEEAAPALTKAIAHYRKTGHQANLLLALEARAVAWRYRGETHRVGEDLEQSLALYLSLGERVRDHSLRIALAGTLEDAFDQMVRFQLEVGKDVARAVYFLEMGKAINDPRPREIGAEHQPVHLDRVVDQLPPATAIVEYAVLEDRLVTAVISHSSQQVYQREVGRTALREMVEEFQTTRWGSPRWLALAGHLYELLVAPWRVANDFQTVVLVPDKELFRIAFPVLRNPATGHYLVEEETLEISPSATFVTYAPAQKTGGVKGSPGAILVLAAPAFDRDRYPTLGTLESARDEGEAIQARFGQRVRLLVGAEATTDAFRRWAPESEWIHFAGHALLDPDRPLESLLVLAPDLERGGAGTITGTELAHFDFKASLVTLSACDTAGVPREAWSGSLSLVRPFLAAGVRSVVASLEKVDDEETKKLFVRFAEALAEGVRPEQALRKAQLQRLHESGDESVKKDGWPAFQIYGASTSNSANQRSFP